MLRVISVVAMIMLFDAGEVPQNGNDVHGSQNGKFKQSMSIETVPTAAGKHVKFLILRLNY